MTLAGQVFSNRYEIEREVARGGMAEVYLARDQLLNRPVALKVLFPEYAREPSFVERFRREAQAAANLNHPNIVAIYDWGQEGGTYFIVMEYVEGRSLRDLLRAEGPLDPHEAAEIAAEIAAALAFAHRSGVVHRDVKPGNVLITRNGNVKVTDFGIARAGTSDALTQTGSVMGTATYFSPEQAQGQMVDGRSDVYSLGVVLYEMVTGVAPFTGDSPVSVAYKHVREDPPAPSRRNPEVPPELEQIILTAMAKDPNLRYQTADDMRSDLLRFRRGRPLAAAPVTALVTEVPSATVAQAAGAYAAAATIATPRVDDRGRYAEGPTYERKRRPWITTTLVLLGLAAAIALILFAAIKLGDKQSHVTVPNEVGKQVTAAQQSLQAQHLIPAITKVADSRTAGLVINQNPAAGTNVAKDSTVKLFVSSGAALKTIPPDIVNETYDAAQKELSSLLFVVQRHDQASDTVPPNLVISSTPAPGTQAPQGSIVVLVVSSGPQQFVIPDLTGDTLDQAKAELTSVGFTGGFNSAQEASATVPVGIYTRTDPPKGTKLAKNKPITIYTSSGPATTAVPSVIGQPVAAAQTTLTNSGFKSSIVYTFDDANVGIVLDQSPPPNSLEAPGTNIVLTVGKKSSSASTTTSTSTP
jgi:serine/threonine-protein kinase